MNSKDREAAAYIDEHRSELSAKVMRRHYELYPQVGERYGAVGRQRCQEDAAYHLQYLAQALALSTTSIFSEYTGWAKVMLGARGIPATDLTQNLEVIGGVLREELPNELSFAAMQYLMAGVLALPSAPEDLPSLIGDDDPLSALGRQYLAALLAYDKASAAKLILDAAGRGVPVRAIYDHVFVRVQCEIGRLWQLNKLTVAEEHYCTAATQLSMAQLYSYLKPREKNGRVMVGMCATGDLHELGANIVCDFFEMEGWDTTFLGANVPINSAIRMIRARRADVVAVSASIPYHIAAVEQLVKAIRASSEFDRVQIVVGGGAFRTDDVWRKVGADAYGRTAAEALTAVQ